MNGASAATLTVVLSLAISRVTFTVTGGPSKTLTARLSVRKPSRVTVNVYLPGARKKNWYKPSRSVFADAVVPLALSLISTSTSGTTAALGSVTTPVKPPEVVVCADESRIEKKTRARIARSWIGGFHLVEAHLRFQPNFTTGITTYERSCNTTPYLSPPGFFIETERDACSENARERWQNHLPMGTSLNSIARPQRAIRGCWRTFEATSAALAF